MTNHEATGHFMTPRFAGYARAAGVIAIHTDVEQLAGMNEFVKGESGFGLPADADRLDFAYFWTAKGPGDNLHYYQAHGDTPFFPNDSLEYANPFTVPKRNIEARNRNVVELQTHDLTRPNPLSFAAARAMLAQTPEQAGLAVDSAAWIDFAARKGNATGVVDAIIGGFVPERLTRPYRLAEEAVRRFPRVIELKLDQN